MNKFNPTDVPINITLRYQEINLILNALGKLPFDQVAPLYGLIHSEAIRVIQDAEKAHQESIEWEAAVENVSKTEGVQS